MLARNAALRSVACVQRSSAPRLCRLARALSSTAQDNASVVQDNAVANPTVSSTGPVKQIKSLASKPHKPIALATSGRSKRLALQSKSPAGRTKLLLSWTWFPRDSPERSTLADALQSQQYPDWLDETYTLASTFRSARARRWIPTAQDIQDVEGKEVTDVQAWLEEQQSAHTPGTDPDEQLDMALIPIWSKMSASARQAAQLRVRFECIQRLGWRLGYSSGYPRPQQGDQSHLPTHFGAKTKEGLTAFKELHKKEDALAWQAWLSLSSQERTAEMQAAWINRDRSLLYLDDSESCKVLGAIAPRWYAEPERAGVLTFLPNTIVRLVKNYVRPDTEYDPWKATFRVPLSMHKHGLRTYLLQIYGLKTTWARSMIYRSPVTRNSRTGKKITGRARTHKKVEVGLLEPFLFPEISPDFQKRQLFASELDFERRTMYIRMSKAKRWRGTKSIAQYEQELANLHKTQYHKLDPLSAPGVHESETKEYRDFPRLIVRAKGIPSAKHGKILELLNTQRREKDARVNALIAQYQKEAQDRSNSDSST